MTVWHTASAQTDQGTTMSKEQVVEAGEKLADSQLAALKGDYSRISWESGVMWAGYAEFAHCSDKPAYSEALTAMGQRVQWTPPTLLNQPFHADYITIGQAFMEVYARTKDPAILAPLKPRLDVMVDRFLGEEAPGRLAWWWCDALFMGGPVMARMSTLTGDPKYLAALDTELGRMADLLYDKQEHLYYRDKSFISKVTKNGKKVFWSRGNGWVFAGLAKLLPEVPESDPARARYVQIFKEMAVRLASLQQPDGTWHPSLLDSEEYPDSETSGTALDCCAFAWGINHRMLDRATYLPVAAKAWAALLAARMPNGRLGYVQGVGDRPGSVRANSTVVYSTGQFLLAATELSKLAPFQVPPAPTLSVEPPPPPTPRPSATATPKADSSPSVTP